MGWRSELKSKYHQYFDDQVYIGLGDGWQGIIVEFLANIDVMLTDDEKSKFKIVQIKEKFGSLRIYVVGGTPAIDDLLERLYAKSDVTCEQCGEVGKITQIKHWVKCLCESCREKEENRHVHESKYQSTANCC